MKLFLGINLVGILLVVVIHLNFQVLFLNKVLDNLVVVEDILTVVLHSKEAIFFQVVLHILFRQAFLHNL
jgi:hypothetical protein